MSSYYFGVDFGTTNSAAFAISKFVDSDAYKYVIGEDEKHPLPSYVAINKVTGEVRTGTNAKNSITQNDEYEVFSSIKSIIDSDREWKIADKIWTPIQITAELFKALKSVAAKNTLNMEDIVVAVPVGFSSIKKNNIRKAAKLAGLNVKMFVSEPTAAFCSKKDEMKRYSNVAVFDWGGGTLDVSILNIENNIVRELATDGLFLAGNDIDRKIANRLCMQASKKSGKDFGFESLSDGVQKRLLQKCEVAKCSLADEDIVTVRDANLDGKGMMLERIDYDYFELLIEEEVNQAVHCLLRAISNSGLNRESIDCILCEGGSSRLRPLQNMLLRYFDRSKLIFPKSAMWDIAEGSAVIASKPGCYMLSRPIGLIQSNNTFYQLLKVGQRIPTEQKTVKFGLTDYPEEARFVMTDGDTPESQTFIEDFNVKLRGFKDEYVIVTCYVDADMIFKMKVHSNKMPDDVFRVWTYSNLNVAYELDEPEGVSI